MRADLICCELANAFHRFLLRMLALKATWTLHRSVARIEEAANWRRIPPYPLDLPRQGETLLPVSD